MAQQQQSKSKVLDELEIWKKFRVFPAIQAGDFVQNLVEALPGKTDKIQQSVLDVVDLCKIQMAKAKKKGEYYSWLRELASEVLSKGISNRNWVEKHISKLPPNPKTGKSRKPVRPKPIGEPSVFSGPVRDIRLGTDPTITQTSFVVSGGGGTSTPVPSTSAEAMEVDILEGEVYSGESGNSSELLGSSDGSATKGSPKPRESPLEKSPSLVYSMEGSRRAALARIAANLPPPSSASVYVSTGEKAHSVGQVSQAGKQEPASTGEKAHSVGQVSQTGKQIKRPIPSLMSLSFPSLPSTGEKAHSVGQVSQTGKSINPFSESASTGEKSQSGKSRKKKRKPKSAKSSKSGQSVQKPATVAASGESRKRESLIESVGEPSLKVAKVEPKMTKCQVPGCSDPNIERGAVKVHAMTHIPEIFDEGLGTIPEIVALRVKALECATSLIFGINKPLQSLCDFISASGEKFGLKKIRGFGEAQRQAMQAFCKELGVTLPQQVTLKPANSVGALVHWRAVLKLASCMNPVQRDLWLNNFKVPAGIQRTTVADVVMGVGVQAFDSHFHLDRTLQAYNLPSNGTLENLREKVPVPEGKEVNLVGSVAVYCDPERYPTRSALLTKPENMHIAIGFHPKKAIQSPALREQYLKDFRTLVKDSHVQAIGEVGLDFSESSHVWQDQEDLLNDLLPSVVDSKVLVLHCRGMGSGDCVYAIRHLLSILQRNNIPEHQPIHFHCFTGSKQLMEMWLRVYYNTYFGFTRLVNTFNKSQLEAVKAVPECKLLLESDAPYFHAQNIRASTPYLLFETAEIIAEARGVEVRHILDITVTNGIKLYQNE
ncbi:uncharacterized protein LOC106164908 isoform X2 [Lingula anatina]|uniref:Uncharacterized protein LOC106164908 isoform X2 n=1 Tax=Lingula anatina TaxID=7574 RepID=A0A1S3ILL3_LINAN|nr:uncharacterized protein LOC106164908 isoform X2 [Lingula anatina]|eukprot:XP_013398409.1 uncharacterized protein LOC106164908 isoform X2 [Lingula anatina]